MQKLETMLGFICPHNLSVHLQQEPQCLVILHTLAVHHRDSFKRIVKKDDAMVFWTYSISSLRKKKSSFSDVDAKRVWLPSCVSATMTPPDWASTGMLLGCVRSTVSSVIAMVL